MSSKQPKEFNKYGNYEIITDHTIQVLILYIAS